MNSLLKELQALGYIIHNPSRSCTRHMIRDKDIVYLIGSVTEDFSSDKAIEEIMRSILDGYDLEKYIAIIQRIDNFDSNPIFGNFMLIRSVAEAVRYMKLTTEEHNELCTTFEELDNRINKTD